MASIGGFSLNDWIPHSLGGPSDRGRAQPTPSNGMQWVGDKQLPAHYTLNDAGKGWYDVMDGTQRAGVLQPGGPNGRFNRDPNYIRPLQQQMAQQLRQAPPGPAPMTQQLGTGSAPRTYAPNPFQKQMAQAQQLRMGR